MPDLIILLISIAVGIGTFYLISRKFGSDCIP
jgi:hypothetical protein